MRAERVLTGRDVFFITAGAFAVIIGVNLTLAVQAVRTFPGLEVPNSYVASQEFQAGKVAQDSLGWTLVPEYERGSLSLRFTGADGAAVAPALLTAVVGRTTVAAEDRVLEFSAAGEGYAAEVALDRGKWMLMVRAVAADGRAFRQRIDLFVER